MFNLLRHRTSIFWMGLCLLILCTLIYILNFSSLIDKSFIQLFVNLKQSSLPNKISEVVIIEIGKKELLQNKLWPWGKGWFPYLASLLSSYDPKGILFLLPQKYSKLNIEKNKKNLSISSVVSTYGNEDLILKENGFFKIKLFKKKRGKIKYSNFSRLLCMNFDCNNNLDKDIREYSLKGLGFPFSTFPVKKGSMLINLVSPSKISHFNYFDFLVNVQGLNPVENGYNFKKKFNNKIIIFSDGKKSFSTLLGPLTKGEIYASAVYTAIYSDFVRKGAIFSIPFIFLTGILLFTLFTKFNLGGRTITWVGSIFLINFVCFYMYDLFGILMSPFTPILFSTLFYINVNFFRLVEHRDTKLELKKEKLAREIKKEVIPSKPPVLKGGSIYWKMIHSHKVGGDFFNTIKFNNRVTVFLGTISKKGLEGTQQIESINNKLNLYYNKNGSLISLFKRLNQEFRNEACEGEIIKLSATEIQLPTGIVKFITAGQVTPFVITPRSSHLDCIKPLDPTPLGLYENREFSEQVFRLYNNNLLVILSEGMYEFSHLESQGEVIDFEKIFSTTEKPVPYFLNEIISESEEILGNSINFKDRTLIIFRKE